ncbi:MAG TPA: hypothetical protein VJU83_03190, partial [Burkholderiales bacterium]|nr:hypothetical protein [Burkholderiales bacterium]
MTAAAPPLDPRNPVVPFTLEVGGKPLYAQTLLRHLPGKRIVVAGEWDGRQIVAKIYIDPKRAHVHAAREAAGMKAMADRGVATARLLAQAHSNSILSLVFEYLRDTETALHRWQVASSLVEQKTVMNELVRTVASLHASGLVQEDLHLRNFLIGGGRTYTLDGASIKIVNRSAVRFSKALDNLALLFAQVDSKFDALIEDSYKEYIAQLGNEFSQEDVIRLHRAVQRRRERRSRDHLAKLFRSCTAFETDLNANRFWVIDRRYDSAALRAFLENPHEMLREARILKDGRTSTVATIRLDGRQLLVKRYNIKSPWHALKRSIQRTRAAVSWHNAHVLQLCGFATPQPVALLETRRGLLKHVSYFITEYVDAPDCYYL